MKKLTLIALILSTGIALQAQDITKEKLIGKWKLLEMKTTELNINVGNPQAMKATLYKKMKQDNPGTVATAADSARIDSVVALLTAMVVELTFKSDDTYTGVMDLSALGNELVKLSGTYKLKKNTLSMAEKGSKKTDKIEIAMANANTLTLYSFGGEGVDFKFARKK